MAINRTKIVTGECDGPCGKKFQTNGVPRDWDYIKFTRPSVPNHVSAVKGQAFVCPACSIVAQTLLQEAGFKIEFANEQKNGESK